MRIVLLLIYYNNGVCIWSRNKNFLKYIKNSCRHRFLSLQSLPYRCARWPPQFGKNNRTCNRQGYKHCIWSEAKWCCPPFYIYKKADVERIDEAISDGCGVDAPGSLISWMCVNSRVFAFEMPGKRYDIGDLESYEEVKKEYKGILW